MRHIPGVILTEAGRANGSTGRLESDYDGYAECVRVQFDSSLTSLEHLISCFFEIIDPYSLNRQGDDVGEKYRTGVYSLSSEHLTMVKDIFRKRSDCEKILVEVMPLTNFLRSAEEHQDRLQNFPNDYCHLPQDKLHKYKTI